jgi:hypothetical protein
MWEKNNLAIKYKMESSLSESVQQLVRPGKCVDVYYPDPQTAEKQCFRTTVNTRYTQDFTNLGGGTSVFTIPPNNGLQDVVVSFTLPALAQFPGASATGLALGRGWGYALIKQISFRYGGSSQYFMTGQQVLQSALSMASDTGSRDAILSLGGNACLPADFGSTGESAYVWLPLPHCNPTSEGKLPPLPSDLLTQQVQISVELYPLTKIFSLLSGIAVSAVPTSLAQAKFQVQQVILENQGDALARRVDMTSHALSYPINFRQQEVLIQLNGGQVLNAGAVQQVVLSGFRQGEVKEIHAWLTADNDSPIPGSGAKQNPFSWYALNNAQMTYAGEVYARFDQNSGQLWNLINGRIPAQVNTLEIEETGGALAFSDPITANWTVLPFAQAYDATTAHSMYMAGKSITNGLVNLSFSIPPGAVSSAYTLHISYVYNAVLTFSQGTCDYVF